MVDLDIDVRGQTVVAYEVMPSGVSGSCGDGTAPAFCQALVPEEAEVSFSATPVAQHSPVWRDSCVAVPGSPWEARIASARAGARCTLEVRPDEPVDCGSVTNPLIRIIHRGEVVPISEVFAEISTSQDPVRVDLEDEGQVVEPASYLWEDGPGGVFSPLGQARNLSDVTLGCPRGSTCPLRATVSDTCGTRQTEIYYRITD